MTRVHAVLISRRCAEQMVRLAFHDRDRISAMEFVEYVRRMFEAQAVAQIQTAVLKAQETP